MSWSRRSWSLSVLAACVAALCGCNSTNEAPMLPDATADGASQMSDGAATESGREAPTPDATMPDGAEASTPDAASPDGNAEASPIEGGVPDVDASDGGPSDGASDGGSDAASDGGPDGAADDGGPDGAADAGEGGIAMHLLVPGTTLAISAATSDDYLIYYDSSTQTYYAPRR